MKPGWNYFSIWSPDSGNTVENDLIDHRRSSYDPGYEEVNTAQGQAVAWREPQLVIASFDMSQLDMLRMWIEQRRLLRAQVMTDDYNINWHEWVHAAGFDEPTNADHRQSDPSWALTLAFIGENPNIHYDYQ